MKLTAKTKLCMVIGDPVEHSLGPAIYNVIYKRLGIDDQYVYVACRIDSDKLADFVKGVRAMGIMGVSCTIPHKEAVMKHLDSIDSIAAKIGAVNTIVNENGILKGYNADWIGAVAALEKLTNLHGAKVAILGAGGASRAIAYGVTSKGAQLTVYNRTLEKAEEIARLFGGRAASLDELSDVQSADIIINATSVGLSPNSDSTPLEKKFITNKHIVFDTNYTPYQTRLLSEASQKGARIIHGTEMFIYQAIAQFKVITGLDLSEDLLREVLQNVLDSRGETGVA